MVASKESTMSERRALLTDREREIVAGDADVEDSYRYQTISRVRARFDRLAADLEALEAHGALADELRELVCATDERGAAGDESEPTPTPGGDIDSADDGDGRPRADADEDLADELRAYLERNEMAPKTTHGRGAVVDTFRYLREHGTTDTSELQDAVYANYTDNWSDKRTMWNAIDRHLNNDDIPGIQKGGYGEWEYAGDDAVRAALDEL